jgi:hypothetical protein
MLKALKKLWAMLVLWDYCPIHHCNLTFMREGPFGTTEMERHAFCPQCDAERQAMRREREKRRLERRAKLIQWLEA